MNNYNWLFDLEQPNFAVNTDSTTTERTRPLITTTPESFGLNQQSMCEFPEFATNHLGSRTASVSYGVPSPQSQQELSVQSGPRLKNPNPTPAREPHTQSGFLPDAREGVRQQYHNPMPSSPDSDGCNSFMGKSSEQSLVLDDISRGRILDLVVEARPQTAEGTLVTRDHPLLTLGAMQSYCDLFFYRFNKSYPLIHRATFEPSRVEPLLLLSIMLLGATYGGKDAHRLAVCIHDITRTQVIQHSAFTATPELWMLQVILLIECFGKSRAGQKQHDMSHLFHGMLIK